MHDGIDPDMLQGAVPYEDEVYNILTEDEPTHDEPTHDDDDYDSGTDAPPTTQQQERHPTQVTTKPGWLRSWF